MLYVSRSTITNDIRNVEDSLKSYHITLIRRPNYGLHIQGSEFDIRNCMISQFKDNKWAQRFSDKEENELKEISKILLNNIQNQKSRFVKIYDSGNDILYLYCKSTI